jgi:hypothetical protein
VTDEPYPKDSKGRFLSGNIGGGRPKGARNQLSEDFLKKLQQDFREHGQTAIERCRDEKPEAYVKMIASLLPKEAVITHRNEFEDMGEEELVARLRQLQSDIAPFLGGGAASDRIAIEDHTGKGKASSVY